MPRITKVYTRTGDDGTTGLGNGARVPKDSLRIGVVGDVDELNAYVGWALSGPLAAPLRGPLREIQNNLFHLGADLCVPESGKKNTPVPLIEKRHVDELEKLMDRMTLELKPLENFVLPGGTPGASLLHVARTVARRAERAAVALSRREKIGGWVIRYLNRLSDTLFVMARYENLKKGKPDIFWNSRK